LTEHSILTQTKLASAVCDPDGALLGLWVGFGDGWEEEIP